MDSVELMDDVDFALWRDWFHAVDILEAQVVSNQHALSYGLHCA